MDPKRSRGTFRLGQAEAIELGNEPPLSADGHNGLVDRRRISVHWYAGTILTALCGMALMGGAVFTSLDGETKFASLPDRIEMTLRGAFAAAGDKSRVRKSDRLPTAEEVNPAHQVIRVSTTARSGNHEIVRVRPFIRVASNLALTTSDLSTKIAPFKLADVTAESADAPREAPPTEPDAEVSFVLRNLAPIMPSLKIALLTPKDEVIARVRETAEWSQKIDSNVADAANITGIKIVYAGQPSVDPYEGFGARIVPENVTLLPKTTNQTSSGNPFNEKLIVAKKGDSITSILRELGAKADDIVAITKTLEIQDSLKEGQRLRVLMSSAPNASAFLRPIRVIVANDTTIDTVVALADNDKFVRVDVNNVDNAKDAADNTAEDDQNNRPGVHLYQSIYETALRKQIPQRVIDAIIQIYAFDIDFDRKVQPGDAFDILYASDDDSLATDNHGEVFFTSLTIGGEVKNFYRFLSPDDGLVDYYDENGKSAKKFLLRKPVADGVLRSGFGLRQHPVLGYTKIHTGVDWAAPIGTPIYAAGNGIVEKAQWESGYGKFILLRHNNGYESAYGHMSAFARGVEEGTRVRQGQVIGFVGSTGLSTGPHVHYEIRVNDRFVDPMRIKLPRGRELQGQILAEFTQERERIDGIMARKPERVAVNR